MKEKMGALIMKKREREEFNKWLHEEWNGSLREYFLHWVQQDLKTLWKQVAYTEREQTLSANILEKMANCGEMNEIADKMWEEVFGKEEHAKKFTKEERRKIDSLVSDCSFLIMKEVHKRTLEHLRKMSH